jgi:hypothetical protein
VTDRLDDALLMFRQVNVIVYVGGQYPAGDPDAAGDDQKRVIEPIGRYGLAGRGLAASLVGVYWVSAALHTDPSQAHELGGALQSVQEHAKGWLLLLPLALAFAASAIFDFVQALFHRPNPDVDLRGTNQAKLQEPTAALVAARLIPDPPSAHSF